MSFNSKQIVTIGLGLGIATAFAFRTLHHQDDRVSVSNDSSQLQPIQSFDVRPMQLPGVTERRPLMPDGGEFEVPSKPDSMAVNDFTPSPDTDLQLQDPLDHPMPPSEMLPLASSSDPELAPFDRSESSFPATAAGQFPTNDGAFDPGGLAATPRSSDSEMTQDLPVPTNHPMPATTIQDREAPPAYPKGWQSNPFVNGKPEGGQSHTSQPASDLQVALSSFKGADGLSGAPIATDEKTAQVVVNSVRSPESNQFEATSKKWPSELLASSETSNTPETQRETRETIKPVSRWESTVETRADSDLSAPVAVPEPTPAQIPLPEAVAQRAVHHIEYGKTLSRRGAGFSARQEFLAAVQVLAESNDQYSGDRHHTDALRRAMLIIKEAEDFGVGNAEQQIQMDVASVVGSHQCQVVTVAEAGSMSPGAVLNRYFYEAQRQLDIAGGRSVVSAEVFYCLGKLQSMLPGDGKVTSPLDVAKTVVFHQAALKSDRHHHRSANELGVIFARQGRLEQSKSLFEASLLAAPTAATWQNLAEVHARLGETELAQAARNEFALMVAQPASANAGIQWQEAEQFKAQAPVSLESRLMTQPEAIPDRSADESNKSFSERLKSWF